MSIIGIDFGNEACLVTAAKAGFIETLTNDYSLRATPSCVAFDEKKRIMGVAAKNQQVTNMANTVCGFKHLLGRKYDDPHVQRELKFIPTAAERLADGGIGLKVNYLGKPTLFTPVQLTAMVMTKLKEIAVTSLHAQVNDCVVTCPVFFTNAERKALLDACHIAGINVLRLMNETTATALHYGFYKTDLPEDKPRNVIFVDCGHSSLQVSAVAFTKGKLKVLASTWDLIGGRDIDATMAAYFVDEFQERYKINARSNERAYLRLLTEVEKLKKQMSANSTRLPMGIECFMGDIDVQSHMQRPQMEELCASIFKRVEVTFRKLLQESKLTLADIHSVEIVGGSTRVPAIKHLIEEVFGKPASTTLNQDESVSSGATLQCAMMSPAMRAREFGVTDIQNYAVKVSWDGEGNTAGGELIVFPTYHATPFSRLLTLNRREPFAMTVAYAQEIPYPDPVIGKWYIKDVKPTEHGEPQEVKVKVRVNNHGLVLISGASLVDKKVEIEEMQVNEDKPGGDQQANAGENAGDAAGNTEGTEKKKKQLKLIDLPMEVKTHGYTAAELAELSQQEAKMIAIDAKEKERADSRNALEEYVYDMREKLSEGGNLERFVVNAEREAVCAHLQELADWLYEEGEDCEREIYDEKLKGLRSKTNVINDRAHDYENCPAAFEDLKHSIMMARDAVHEYKRGSSKYEHLTETDFLNISEACDKTHKWFETNLGNFSQTPRTTNCPVKLEEILQQNQQLTTLVNGILKRPKPKAANADSKSQKDQNQQQQQQGNNGDAEHNGDDVKAKMPKSNDVDDSTMDVE